MRTRTALPLVLVITLLILLVVQVRGYHDCVQASRDLRQRRRQFMMNQGNGKASSSKIISPTTNIPDDMQGQSETPSQTHLHANKSPCKDGLCVGMTNGPHQGGNASYPVAWNGTHGTVVYSTMLVPEYPAIVDDSITYYIWTDIFFGDSSRGRMNQFVPQLLLGNVLDGSTGSPEYKPQFHVHTSWMFGAHYFFETWNPTLNKTESHAAYGELFPTVPGEVLFTKFELVTSSSSRKRRKHSFREAGDGDDTMPASKVGNDITVNKVHDGPIWNLTMGVVGDSSRISFLEVPQPYMGLGTKWKEHPTASWTEPPYHNMCVNACWELYGAEDASHLPSSGSRYILSVTNEQFQEHNDTDTTGNDDVAKNGFPFTTWERDEGNGVCPSCQVRERHGSYHQEVMVDISIHPKTNNEFQETQ